MQHKLIYTRLLVSPCLIWLVLLSFIPAYGQIEQTASLALSASDEPEVSLLWNLFIAAIVLLVCGSIVALCVAAMRQWRGSWRTMAAAPLLILLIWVAVIVFSKVVEPGSHNLWPFEVFAWAMGTSVYFMLLMTAKRTFDKADEEKSDQS